MRNNWIVVSGLVAMLSLSACNNTGEQKKKMPNSVENTAEVPLDESQQARLDGLRNIATHQEQPSNPSEIKPTAIEPYTKRNYPDTVRRFGKAIPALIADRKKAAEIAASDPRCNGVSNVQVATQSPTVNRRYWVECNNLTRFRFDEASLAKGESVGVQTIRDMARDGLITD